MTLLDEVLSLGRRPIPRGAVFTRTYRRSLRHRVANVAHALWLLLASVCIAAVGVVLVAGVAWWIYEELT